MMIVDMPNFLQTYHLQQGLVWLLIGSLPARMYLVPQLGPGPAPPQEGLLCTGMMGVQQLRK